MTIVHSGAVRRRGAAFDDQDRAAGAIAGDFARPVALHRRGADDEVRAAGCGMAQRHDRLPRLAEAHVVGEDGAAAAEQERDAFNLVREEPVGERDGLPVGVVEVVRRPGRGAAQTRRPGRRVERSVGRDRACGSPTGCPFDEVPLGAEPVPSDRAWFQAHVPGRLVHRSVPSREQDDGMACGSWSRMLSPHSSCWQRDVRCRVY